MQVLIHMLEIKVQQASGRLQADTMPYHGVKQDHEKMSMVNV